MVVRAGQILAGKYRVERELGRGAMGVVVAAHHLVLDEQVALKFLLPEMMQRPDAVARFEREARAAVKIKSEHVVRVTDVGRLDSGTPFIVMELLRGRDLAELLRLNGPLRLEDVADYVLQAGEAIAEAHALGIVHRDLKPANLLLTERTDGSSCVKVLDFGISKFTRPSASDAQAMASTTGVLGSPVYMSPEQLASARDVDMRTDVWALAVICYELLTGCLPFVADTLPQLCIAITSAAPTPLRHHRPDLPEELEQLLSRCLQKDRTKRTTTVAELALELVKFAPASSRLSVERIERLAGVAGFSAIAFAATSSGVPLSDASLVGSRTVSEFARTKSGSARARRILMFVVAGVAVAAGLSLFVLGYRVRNLGNGPPVAKTNATPAARPPAIALAPAEAEPVPAFAQSAPLPPVTEHVSATPSAALPIVQGHAKVAARSGAASAVSARPRTLPVSSRLGQDALGGRL